MKLKWSFAMLLAWGSASHAREALGEVKVDNLVVRPQFHLVEPAKGDFKIGESLFSVRWLMDEKTSAVFTIGSKSLLGTSVHYTNVENEDLGFVEAYGEYKFDYGTFRAGLQPVEYSLEGKIPEADLNMPRTLIFQKRWVPLRDVGLSYEISNDGYFTHIMVHNGESGPNLDGRPWVTAIWGWEGLRLRMGLAGQTGSTKPESTSSSADTLAGVDPSFEAQWRQGGPFIQWTPPNWQMRLEVDLGELVQEEKIRKYSSGSFTVTHELNSFFWGLRYDQVDPNQSRDNDRISEVSLALGLVSARRTSRLFLVGAKVFEEGAQIPNDELRLIWHLTPQL